MKAWIENDRIRDICHGNPDECYHPEIAVFYDTEVPDDAVNGYGWVNGVIVPPVIEPPIEMPPVKPIPPKISVTDFLLLFTAIERVAIKTSTDPIVQDFWTMVNDPRVATVDLNLPSMTTALKYLAATNMQPIREPESTYITPARIDEILTGTPL